MKRKSMSLDINGAESNLKINGQLDNNSGFEEENCLSYETQSSVGTNHDHSKELVKFEYHVLYHISYAVPYLCFNAYKSSNFI